MLYLRRILVLKTVFTLCFVLYVVWRSGSIVKTSKQDDVKQCIPGIFGNASQLPWSTWEFDTNKIIPLYQTHDLDELNQLSVEHAVIFLHGNLRNANDYFCAAVNTINEFKDHEKYLVITPQFLLIGDICFDKTGNIIQINETNSCDLPVFTSRGWKDGAKNINLASSNSGMIAVYSYDIYNAIANRLGDPLYFPALRTLTFIGFSAGAQVLNRYSLMSKFNLQNNFISVKYIISDPSSFLYFDNIRPYPNKSGQYGIPNESWLLPTWQRDSLNNSWIESWQSNCSRYNTWRFGFENISGNVYASQYFQTMPISSALNAFASRHIIYLLGGKDTCNCKLKSNDAICYDYSTGICEDHQLAKYCAAMLQGSNRWERLLHYYDYLELYFGRPVHEVHVAHDIPHDPVLMIQSDEAKCIVFEKCDANDHAE